jgi:hypothetical protein
VEENLLKEGDVYFVLKPGCAVWDPSQHEPLGISVSLPLIRHEPWLLRHTQPVVDLARALREVPDDDFVQKGHLLCEFLCLARQLDVKLIPPPVRAGTDAWTNPSAQKATQLRSVLARVYADAIQNQFTTTVP